MAQHKLNVPKETIVVDSVLFVLVIPLHFMWIAVAVCLHLPQITKHGNASSRLINCYCYDNGRKSSNDEVCWLFSNLSTIAVIWSESARLTSHPDIAPTVHVCKWVLWTRSINSAQCPRNSVHFVRSPTS